MVTGNPIIKHIYLCTFCVLFYLCLSANANAQTKVYASSVISEAHTTDAVKAHDGNLTTFAVVSASSGVILGAGAYSGHIDLQFAMPLPANTVSYVKINMASTEILNGLLSGTLNTVLSGILSGNQEFTVEAKDKDGVAVLTGHSQTAGDFNTDRMKLLVNDAGEYLVRIIPDKEYKSIRVTNRLGALIGLGTVKTINVYEAYYITDIPVCATTPVYSSYNGTGSGITVTLLNNGSVGVINPSHAIDADDTNHSTIKMANISVASSIEQVLYFDRLSFASDRIAVRLSVPQTIASVLGSVSVIASNGNTVVQTYTLGSLLTLNVLTPQANQPMTLFMTPGQPVDRITIRLSSVVGLTGSINVYGVSRTLGVPVITQNPAICQGSTSTVVATAPAGVSINWYASSAGGTVLATTTSGQGISTPALTATTTYYARLNYGSCAGPMTPVTVTVINTPSGGTISGEQTVCLTRSPIAFTSITHDSGSDIIYKWESSLNQTEWAEIATSNSPVYQPPILTQTTFYRRVSSRTVGGVQCRQYSNVVKVTIKNCMVISNPMVRQRIKSGV